MKSTLRILITAASVAALLVMMAPAAKAQCVPAQVFASKGLAMAGEIQYTVAVRASGAEGDGNEIGRFWEASNSANANNFDGNCPSTNTADAASTWWSPNTALTNWGIQGAIGAGGTISPCVASSCPTGDTDELIVLIEDYGAGGPPGVGGAAYFLTWRVDPTFADQRAWDYGRIPGVNTQGIAFNQYPTAKVLSSSREPGAVNTLMRLQNVDSAVEGKRAAGDIPDPDTVVSWDICSFYGPSDPGRLRSGYDGCTPVPYAPVDDDPEEPAGLTIPFVADCPELGEPGYDPNNDTFVAVGASFAGGSGGDVASMFVGSATQVECDETLADPDATLQKRPTIRPKRRGGR